MQYLFIDMPYKITGYILLSARSSGINIDTTLQG